MFSKAQQPQQTPSTKAQTPFFKPEPTFKSLATEQQVVAERAPESVMRLPIAPSASARFQTSPTFNTPSNFKYQTSKLPIQAKLTVGQPNDKYEQEADAMADKVIQRWAMPNAVTAIPTITPFNINAAQRACAACEKEDKDHIQRKESGEMTASPSVESRLSATKGGGSSLPESTRTQMESSIGADFSNVRIHTSGEAVQLSQDLSAHAFTHGSDVYFNSGKFSPDTEGGRHLLAHELTHTVQQGSVNNSTIQRQSIPTTDIEVQEKKLKKDFNTIRSTVDATAPSDAKAKKHISEMVLAFKKDFSEYKPSKSRWEIESVYGDTEEWRHREVYSKIRATELSARLLLIGLPKESEFMKQLGKNSPVVPTFPLDRDDMIHKEYTKATLERVDLSTQPKATASLDLLLASFNFMLNEIKKLDMKKVEKNSSDRAFLSSISIEEIGEGWGFYSEWTYFQSLRTHLGNLYGGMQLIIQNKMEAIYSELDVRGEAPSLRDMFMVLQKIETNIPNSIKLSNPVAGHEFLDPTASTTAITRTDFTKKGGKHKDFFDKSAKAPSVNIEFYDKNQEKGAEQFLPIGEMHKIRYKQLDFIMSFYGLNKEGKKQAGAKGPSDIMPNAKHFSLFSLDDWKVFLDSKYDDLVKNQHANTANAFLSIIRLVESYMKAFTIHTPYNIEDKGVNYLNKAFPKALTGQLIQDCGVYALKTVYLLSLLATRLKLKMQYIMLPNHVGLIISGDNTPIIFVHNDMFTVLPVSENQFNSLSDEHKKSILNEKGLTKYEEARKNGDTSKFGFTADKLEKDWLDVSKAQKISGPRTHEQFLAEQAAGMFVNQVDMPFKVIDVRAKDYNPKLKEEKVKKTLWDQYQAMVRNTVFFNEKAMQKKDSPTYQFNLRYLDITTNSKKFHNDVLLPFWNIKARGNWIKLKAALNKSIQDKNKVAFLVLLKAYRDEFERGALEVGKSFEPIRLKKETIHTIATTNTPLPIKAGIDKTVGQRSGGESWVFDFNEHITALDTRIKNLENGTETLNGGTDITPPFAEVEDMLPYFP